MTDPCSINVTRYLEKAAECNPGRLALAMPGGNEITYRELWDAVDRFGSAIREYGMEPGNRIILMIPMSIDLYIAMLGIIKAGGVAVFVDPWIGMRQVAEFCAFSEPSGFIGIPKSHLLRLFSSKLRKLPLTVTTGRLAVVRPAKYNFKSMIGHNNSSPVHNSLPEDSALITFTSGSSGIPKGANRTHGFLDAQYNALNTEFPYLDSDIDMPMFPVFALCNLANGLPSIIPDMDFRAVASVDGEAVFRRMQHYRVTTATASPPFFDKLADYVMTGNKPGLNLRRILTGGAPVRDEQLKNWRNAFPNTEIQIVYGSTEAEPVSHISLEERLAVKGRGGFCTGKPSKLVKTEIIGINRATVDAGEDMKSLVLETGETGELIVSGKHVCKDYFNNPGAVRENKITDWNGEVWHRMGDTGYFDEQGRFWLVGRVHSTIFRNGVAVHPQLIEQAARSNDSRISNIAAIGLPDQELGEKVALVIQSSHDEGILEPDIKTRLADAGLAIDEIIVRNKPLPVDPRHNSKIDYAKLQRQISKG